MTTRMWKAGALGAPFLVFTMSLAAAGGPGTVGLVPEDGLTSGGVLWPTSDFGRNLCPRETLEAADCKIGPKLGGGGLLIVRSLGEVVPAGIASSGGTRQVDLRLEEFAGPIEPIETACGVWSGTYALDTTGASAIFPVWLTDGEAGASGVFTGGFEAVVRFEFVRESDGHQVTLVRTLEGLASGTWDSLPAGELPPGGGHLRLNLADTPAPFWRVGYCRQWRPPSNQ